MIPRILSVGLAVTCANALPRAAFKRHISELRPTYDWVIIGAGTSGLTVADRLTEAFPDSKFLRWSTKHFWADLHRRNSAGCRVRRSRICARGI